MINFYQFKVLGNYSQSIMQAVTTKSISEPFGLSLALHTGEDCKRILTNRHRVASQFSEGNRLHFVVANQTHSDHIAVIREKETKGWGGLDDAVADCDALITNQKGIVLTVLTADCVPLLLYDKNKEVVAAIHAGWKGTSAHIVAKTVKKMIEEYGSNPKDIVAGIAPSIGCCCYEVGEDVAKHFFKTSDTFDKLSKKYMLDLPLINKKQLLDIGVSEANIEMSDICTACEVDRFFSYRKEQGCSGRFMSMIGLKL